MEVCSAVSGAQLARLSAIDVKDKSGKEVKRLLAAEIGVPRFRQRLFAEDGSIELRDHHILVAVPEKVQLVLVNFVPGTGADLEADPYLIAASRRNDSVALEQLLKCPSDPNLTDPWGWAPLHHAARQGHAQAVQLLLEAGAEKDSRAEDQTTAMWMAADKGHFEVVRLLIEAGADCNKGSTDTGTTPLCEAAERGNLEVVRLLIEAGTDCNQGRTTPLYIAAKKGHLEVVRLLLEAGADCNQGTDDTTPINSTRRLEVAVLLLQVGADRNQARTDDGTFDGTPLHVAARHHHHDVVRLLVKAGTDCKARTSEDATPVFEAAEADHELTWVEVMGRSILINCNLLFFFFAFGPSVSIEFTHVDYDVFYWWSVILSIPIVLFGPRRLDLYNLCIFCWLAAVHILLYCFDQVIEEFCSDGDSRGPIVATDYYWLLSPCQLLDVWKTRPGFLRLRKVQKE
eukprot:Skav236620  [mRNA]  locus=scaffold4458:9210:10580:+ [translate_table: standard]